MAGVIAAAWVLSSAVVLGTVTGRGGFCVVATCANATMPVMARARSPTLSPALLCIPHCAPKHTLPSLLELRGLRVPWFAFFADMSPSAPRTPPSPPLRPTPCLQRGHSSHGTRMRTALPHLGVYRCHT
eukprot:363695-Chlamydomonas_euryale.AAC.2